MSTATSVPSTLGLEGDDALATLRATGRRRLALDAFDRFRAADGFSHARALAFQFALTIVPALITVVGLATALDQDTFTRVVRDVLGDLAPGAAGDLITQALRQGSSGAREDSGEVALVFGALATMISGTTAMGQLERSTNRIYGVERDRPPVRKYAVAALLMLTAGVATVLAAILLVAGSTIADAAGWGPAFHVLRWPVALALVVDRAGAAVRGRPAAAPARAVVARPRLRPRGGAVARLHRRARAVRRRERELRRRPTARSRGRWRCCCGRSSRRVALLLGVAFAAQLEAVRAGVTATRVDRDEQN